VQIFNSLEREELVSLINSNGIGVMPTDTLYGLIGTALSPRIVEKIYEIKERDKAKPLIVLIASEEQLKTYFDIEKSFDLWPGKCSLILPVDKFPHLHRGGGTIAFRVPDNSDLIRLLEKTGPLVAPSANREGEEPAKTIKKAKEYFGEKLDFYVDDGFVDSKPSTLIKFEGEKIKVLRKGAVSERFFQ
jgi:L-threonylcarbamoyladenylate synthase